MTPELLQQALETLESLFSGESDPLRPLKINNTILALRTALDSFTQDAQPAAWMTEAQIDEYIDDYEMIGEDVDGRDACHVPTADEKALIKDAIMGLTALPQPVHSELAALRRELEDARKELALHKNPCTVYDRKTCLLSTLPLTLKDDHDK